MASLASIYVKKETLQTLLDVLNKKQGDKSKGISLTISQNDESNKYGQNVTAWVSQTKEQREAKKERFYVGNGSVVWSKGETPTVQKPATEQQPANNNKVEEDPF